VISTKATLSRLIAFMEIEKEYSFSVVRPGSANPNHKYGRVLSKLAESENINLTAVLLANMSASA